MRQVLSVRVLFAMICLLEMWSALFGVASGQTFSVLYRFKAFYDGWAPTGAVVSDGRYLYGTTYYGGFGVNASCGTSGCGTIFQLSQTGKEAVLYRFGASGDGAYPYAGLVRDKSGNLYGTTVFGGTGPDQGGDGTIFEFSPSTGKEAVLYSFCSARNCADGREPYGTLIVDQDGNLYGTTYFGGSGYCGGAGCGTLFKLTGNGVESVLYSFKGGTDGGGPVAGLVMDASGNFYGTTFYGGDECSTSDGCGTVFMLDSDNNENVLYSFCQRPNCVDGAKPTSVPAMDGQGNIYGTTSQGGTATCLKQGSDCGVVFELTPNGKGFSETPLFHAFGKNGYPLGGITIDGSGKLFGTGCGGNSGCEFQAQGSKHCAKNCSNGQVYELSFDTNVMAGRNFTKLHDFDEGDGSTPTAPLLITRDLIYGTTEFGGFPCAIGESYGCGTVFSISRTSLDPPGAFPGGSFAATIQRHKQIHHYDERQ